MSDVSIKITAEGPFPAIRPLTCEFQLGIDQIPVAYVLVDPTQGDLLQKMDEYRRTICNISVIYSDKEINFRCLFDGLSVVIAPGGVSYTAVFKSMFQLWLEVFPFMPGIHPMGINPFIRTPYYSINGSDGMKTELDDVMNRVWATTYDKKAPLIVSVVQCIAAVVTYTIENTTALPPDTANPDMLRNILSDLAKGKNNPNYRKSLQAAADLTKLIDYSAVDGFVINSDGATNMKLFFELFMSASNTNDLWSMLVNAVSRLGGCVVPGLDKLYIVPQCYFLKPASRIKPSSKQFVNVPNFASPAFYDHISLSDNGFKDVSAVALTVSRSIEELGISDNPAYTPLSFIGSAGSSTPYYGTYPDLQDATTASNLRGGLVVTDAGLLGTLYAAYPPNKGYETQQTVAPVPQLTATDLTLTPTLNTTVGSTFQALLTANAAQIQAALALDTVKPSASANPGAEGDIKEVLNNLAQAKFFELKYMDRTGSINLLFSPMWVPGTTGTAFSRYPDPQGMFVDFYVTQVRHSFSPGSATTHVSFAGGRMGESPIGLDKYNLFNYDAKKMTEMQKKYIDDFGK